jgi:hypothetical protein
MQMRSSIALCAYFKGKGWLKKIVFHRSHNEKFNQIFDQLACSKATFGTAMQASGHQQPRIFLAPLPSK